MGSGENFASELRQLADGLAVPGAVAGVVLGDEFHVATHGVTNVEYPQPITAQTLFQVGSVTKTFASAMVMMLVEEGRLTLDDPIGLHLPELGPATGLDTEAITIERTLSHQAGFDGDHLFITRDAHDLSALASARRLFPPGQGYSYNNAGFSIAGAVIEAVTGRPFAQVIRERLLKPLGMRSAGFRADDLITYPVAAPHLVVDGKAYVIRRGGWQPAWQLDPIDHAAGGLAASVDHLATWARFQTTGTTIAGEVLLSKESLVRLHSPVIHADMAEDVALDWFVRDIDGAMSIGHGGSTAGYLTEFIVVPERSFAFIGLTNATNGSWVNDAMRRWAMQEFVGLDDREIEPVPLRGVDVSKYVGRFVHSFGVLDVTQGDAPTQLIMAGSERDDVTGWQPPVDPPRTFALVNDDHAVSLGPGPQQLVRFGSDGRGPVDWLLWGGRRAMRA